jgi:hypothetical protein
MPYPASPGIGADLLPPTQLPQFHQVRSTLYSTASKFQRIIHHIFYTDSAAFGGASIQGVGNTVSLQVRHSTIPAGYRDCHLYRPTNLGLRGLPQAAISRSDDWINSPQTQPGLQGFYAWLTMDALQCRRADAPASIPARPPRTGNAPPLPRRDRYPAPACRWHTCSRRAPPDSRERPRARHR